MKINTYIKATDEFIGILAGVIGQMSDGIWENTPSMKKYWQSLDYHVDANGYIEIEDRHGVCADPVEFFANKIKQIVKIEIEDGHSMRWHRCCADIASYFHGAPTVGDCYMLYELLKGRNVRKHAYASTRSYEVVLTYNGVPTTFNVKALSIASAKEKALKLMMDQVIADVIPR